MAQLSLGASRFVDTSLTLRSYAKVNYTLDILSLRPDGYHNVATVVQTISLADTITLTKQNGPGITLECDAAGVPSDSTNLAFRAAEILLAESDRTDGVIIHLEKRVPPQAGLGGGSSNAATTLAGVNRLLNLGFDLTTLQRFAASLGSDVPLFLSGGTVTVRGRGEAITSLEDGPEFWFVIVKPDIRVSTAWAYRVLDSLPNRQSARATRRMEEALGTGEVGRIYSRMTNDFEQAIFPEHLPVALLHDDLSMARCRTAHLCGSGSAMFGLCLSETDANEAARIMRLKYEIVHVCRTVGRREALSAAE